MKLLYFILFALCLFSCNVQHHIVHQQAGRLACKEKILIYPKFRDHGPIQNYGDLFSQDAEFKIKQRNIFLQGREQIVQRLKVALKTTKTEHIVTSVKLEPLSNGNYKSQSSFTLHLQHLSQSKPPMKITGYYEDLLHFDGKNCVITSRNIIIKSQES